MLLVPHLYFSGQCEAALHFYESLGLGRIRVLSRFEGTPAESRVDPAYRAKVLHSEFEGRGFVFYASDGPDSEPMKGSALLLELTDTAEASLLFEKLSVAGQISVPFGKKFWGDYGNFTDRFGVQWAILVRTAG